MGGGVRVPMLRASTWSRDVPPVSMSLPVERSTYPPDSQAGTLAQWPLRPTACAFQRFLEQDEVTLERLQRPEVRRRFIILARARWIPVVRTNPQGMNRKAVRRGGSASLRPSCLAAGARASIQGSARLTPAPRRIARRDRGCRIESTHFPMHKLAHAPSRDCDTPVLCYDPCVSSSELAPMETSTSGNRTRPSLVTGGRNCNWFLERSGNRRSRECSTILVTRWKRHWSAGFHALRIVGPVSADAGQP